MDGESRSKSIAVRGCTQKGSLKRYLSCSMVDGGVAGGRETCSHMVVLPLFYLCFYSLNEVQCTFQLQTLTETEVQICGGCGGEQDRDR